MTTKRRFVETAGRALLAVTLAVAAMAGCRRSDDDGVWPVNTLLTGKTFDAAVDVDDAALGSVYDLSAFFVNDSDPPAAEVVFCQHGAAGVTATVDNVDFEVNGVAGPPTITRASGSFLTDGFLAGGQVRVSNVTSVPADAYNHEYPLRAVTATVLYLEPFPVGDEWPADLLAQNGVGLTPAGGNPLVQRRTWTQGAGLSAQVDTLFDATGLYVERCTVRRDLHMSGAMIELVTRNVVDPGNHALDTFAVRLFAWRPASRDWDTANVHLIAGQPPTLGGTEYLVAPAFRGPTPAAFYVDGTTGSAPGYGDAVRVEYDGAAWTTTILVAADATQEAAYAGGVFATAAAGGYFVIRRAVAGGALSADAAAYDQTAASPGWQAAQVLYAGEAQAAVPAAVFDLSGNVLLTWALDSSASTIRWRAYDAGAAVWSAEGTLAAPNGNPVLGRRFVAAGAPGDGDPGLVASIDGSHVFFQENDGLGLPIHGLEYAIAGNAMTARALVTPSTDAVLGYRVNAEVHGDVIVSIAQDATGGPALYALRFSAPAGVWSAPADQLNATAAGTSFPGEIWDVQTNLGLGTGDGLALCHQNVMGKLRYYVSRYGAAADAFAAPVDVGSAAGTADSDGRVVIDNGGNLLLLWIGRAALNSGAYARLHSGGSWAAAPATLYAETTGAGETEALVLASHLWLDTASRTMNGTATQLIFVQYRDEDFRRFKLVALRN